MPIEVEGPDGQLHTFPDGSTHDDINRQMSSLYGGQQGNLQPTGGLQRAGDPTAATGEAVMPSMQSVPPYATPEDKTNIALSMILPRGSVQALQNTPGHAYRMEQAKKVSDANAAVEERQRAGINVLKSYAQLLDRFQATPDDVLKGAIGPRNMKPYNQYMPFVGGMTEPQADAAYKFMPNLTGAPSAEAAWNAQNLFGHDVHGITNAMMSGAGKNMNMSDVRQAAFDSAMRDFMMSSNKESAQEILDHAKGIIANDYGLPMYKANQVIKEHLGELAKQKAAQAVSGSTSAGIPAIGEIRKGFRFKGGDPSLPASWEQATP